MRTLVAMRFKV